MLARFMGVVASLSKPKEGTRAGGNASNASVAMVKTTSNLESIHFVSRAKSFHGAGRFRRPIF